MSALPPKADIRWSVRHVRFVPKAENDHRIMLLHETPHLFPSIDRLSAFRKTAKVWFDLT